MDRRKRALEALEMTAKFWSGKRVFVTGHTGFKGGWLCLWLQSLGAKVYGYALNAPTDPHLFGTARVGEGMAGNTDAGHIYQSKSSNMAVHIDGCAA